ncbi:MAG: hypothetical protein K1X75_04035 [Leptospirales bacterium]|nr:hypothetical protein [Leptospirales bacterium]
MQGLLQGDLNEENARQVLATLRSWSNGSPQPSLTELFRESATKLNISAAALSEKLDALLLQATTISRSQSGPDQSATNKVVQKIWEARLQSNFSGALDFLAADLRGEETNLEDGARRGLEAFKAAAALGGNGETANRLWQALGARDGQTLINMFESASLQDRRELAPTIQNILKRNFEIAPDHMVEFGRNLANRDDFTPLQARKLLEIAQAAPSLQLQSILKNMSEDSLKSFTEALTQEDSQQNPGANALKRLNEERLIAQGRAARFPASGGWQKLSQDLTARFGTVISAKRIQFANRNIPERNARAGQLVMLPKVTEDELQWVRDRESFNWNPTAAAVAPPLIIEENTPLNDAQPLFNLTGQFREAHRNNPRYATPTDQDIYEFTEQLQREDSRYTDDFMELVRAMLQKESTWKQYDGPPDVTYQNVYQGFWDKHDIGIGQLNYHSQASHIDFLRAAVDWRYNVSEAVKFLYYQWSRAQGFPEPPGGWTVQNRQRAAYAAYNGGDGALRRPWKKEDSRDRDFFSQLKNRQWTNHCRGIAGCGQ